VYWGDTVLGGLVQAWSLCTELSFYLFLPIWAAVVSRVKGSVAARQRAHLVGLAALYVGATLFRAQLRSGGHAIGYAWLPANLDLFALGMALAVVRVGCDLGRPVPALLRTLGDVPAAAWLAAVCCYGGVVALHYPVGLAAPSIGQETARQVLFGAIAFLVVAPAVIRPASPSPILRALRWRPLVAAGIVSYGVYLWHLSVMEWLLPHLPVGSAGIDGFARPSFVAVAGSALVISLGLAAASWFALERPILRRIRGIHRSGPRHRPGTADALPSSD
jgi:peptidoglycan/LPS O-acetylase OafA/YrhL